MNAVRLLAELEARGATVALAGNGLDIVAPRGVLTPKVLAAVKARKAALLQLLCGCRKRVMLPIHTEEEWDAMNACSYADAEMLRQRLVASGTMLVVLRRAGNLRFDEERLCIEYDAISPEDWDKLLELRAELLHMLGTSSPHIAEFDAGGAYEATADEADTEEER